MTGQEGTAFVLTNDAMPGFARFEFTTKDDIAERIRKINKSDLPLPFRLYFAALVNDCELLNRNLHYLFADHCDARASNFFRINPDLLRATIELAATSLVELSDEEVGISAEKRLQMEQLKTSQDASLFGAFSARPGTTLYFSKDPTISCTALENGMIDYGGAVLTPADATIRALQQIGFDWSEVSASGYWVLEAARPADKAGDSVNSVRSGSQLLKVVAVRNDDNDSPVVFIRNDKL
jgi:hypothetical protein